MALALGALAFGATLLAGALLDSTNGRPHASRDFLNNENVHNHERARYGFFDLDLLPGRSFYDDDTYSHRERRSPRSADTSASSVSAARAIRLGVAAAPALAVTSNPDLDAELVDGASSAFFSFSHPAFGALDIAPFEHGYSDILAAPPPPRPYPLVYSSKPGMGTPTITFVN